MHRLTTLLLLALAAPAAFAQKLPAVEWLPVGRAGSVLVEYTRSGMQRVDGSVVAFSRTSLVEGVEEARRQRIEALRAAGLSARGYERYVRQTRRSEYDCEGRRVRSLAVTDYDEAGTVLAWVSTEGAEAAWTAIPAGSIGAKLLDAVCAAAAP
jgi:hypothetical protein